LKKGALNIKQALNHGGDCMKKYLRFAAMITASTIAMYFLMYLNIYEWSHFVIGETRLYMALIMGSAMAMIMLTFMLQMYTNKKINVCIYAFSIALFAVSLFLVRSQMTVDDRSYMKSMIPHHSIAILTSERANISDPRVRQLADEIIETQEEEIAEMKRLIRDFENERAEQRD
jgi:FlaA1/EpsC-like NDP-sugar epimerase